MGIEFIACARGKPVIMEVMMLCSRGVKATGRRKQAGEIG